ncbi:efflux transporter outer membrane subunit [Sphingomonas abietis]|uniref:TolC family protein n=1 Tax=Sphingomonas abietis TaxID=3012344 RepID=A0ABY7NSA8_9SPHN|nr:TolC family protein [Sphingomonas abietis]WBO24258.1 TolC family protein [Sphingomonas abietis]
MKRAVAIALTASLAGCTVGPNYRQPPVLSGAVAPPVLAGGREAAYDGVAPLPPHWWQLYDDPMLNDLEEKALARNTDLRVALASLEQAQAALRGVQLQRTPQTSLAIEPSYGQASGDSKGSSVALKPGAVYEAMGTISYDLDLFGKLRRSIEASKADVGAAQAALDLARVNVAAQTAGAYASVCSAGLRIAVTHRSIAIAQQSLDVTQRRFDAGIAGINDVVRARTLLRQTAATLPALITQQRSGLYMLATLTGDAPEAFPAAVATCSSPPLIRKPVPIGDGAALLARRPDVRQAERKLAAAVAAIGVSTASLYPSISLGGSIGTIATSLPDIVSNRAFQWNVGPLVTWNIPNLGPARAQVAQSNAAARGALASFDGTVLTALRETETSLTTLARELDTERQLADARDDAATANANTARLYAGGIGEFLDTLDAERTLIEAENALASTTAQVSQDQIALFMALGGGWQDSPAVIGTSLTQVTDKPH